MPERLSIVIVDDDTIVRDMLHDVIHTHFPASFVMGAGDLRDARALVETVIPTLMLVDRELPDGDGLDFVREIRANPSLARTGIVVMTADASDMVRDAARAAGADMFLAKPFGIGAVVATVRAVTDAVGSCCRAAGAPSRRERGAASGARQ